jgi:hypothetical protein
VPITLDTFFSGLHPEDRARTQVVLERALDPSGNGEYYAEYRVISHADGSERWVAATGHMFFENGRAVHMIGTGQDISERKRAEAALRESEERFRNMADTAPVLIWVCSADKRRTFFNKPWLDLQAAPWIRTWATVGRKVYIPTISSAASPRTPRRSMRDAASGWNIGCGAMTENIAGS